MKKYFLLCFLISHLTLNASINDSISSVYKKSEFVTHCQLSGNSPDSIANEVINKFVHQMCYDLNGLFTWGLRGMSLADKKEELIRFDFKATKFDKRTNILRGIGDVIIPGVKTFPNVYIDSKVTQKKSINGHREVKLELASKNPFIKKMVGTFIYIPKAKNRYAYFTLETHIQFEWFFDIFITKYKYKKFLEWRLKQLVRNIKDETDKETNQLIHKSINE